MTRHRVLCRASLPCCYAPMLHLIALAHALARLGTSTASHTLVLDKGSQPLPRVGAGSTRVTKVSLYTLSLECQHAGALVLACMLVGE